MAANQYETCNIVIQIVRYTNIKVNNNQNQVSMIFYIYFIPSFVAVFVNNKNKQLYEHYGKNDAIFSIK